MAAVIEVKYFNSFILKKTIDNGTKLPYWNGSFGVPSTLNGSTPVSSSTPNATNNWALEEARIRGGYNNTTVDFGPKAFLVEDEPFGSIRGNTLIYSGIFNSRTGINETNVFNVGQDITKSLDPIEGSIQKLYSENTNLTIFQENKVSYALIDKDAIYTAEGGGTPVSQLNLVIGQIIPYLGNFGISTNPDSFAVYGYRKYFTDIDRNAVLRLSRDGITEISNYGMYDFFRDEFGSIKTSTSEGKIVGGWDIHNKQYLVSLQNTTTGNYSTLSFDETVNGWTSFFTYKPDQVLSIRSDFYSLYGGKLWKHYDTSVERGSFYGTTSSTSITFIFNPSVSLVKNFKTINYEGSNGWQVDSFISDATGPDLLNGNYVSSNDSTTSVYSYQEGEYIINPTSGIAVYPNSYAQVFNTTNPGLPRSHAGFYRKENKYCADVINNSSAIDGEVRFGGEMTGIKGYYATVTISTDDSTDLGSEKQLFSVSSDYVQSSY